MGLVARLAISYILISGTSIKEASLDLICTILVTLFMTLFLIQILYIINALNSDFVTYSRFTYTLIGVIRFFTIISWDWIWNLFIGYRKK